MSKTVDVYDTVIALVKEIKEALVDTLATLWHFSIIDTPSLLHPQQHQWLFFPSYSSLHNKGICWFSKGQVALFSTSLLSPPPSLPGVPTASCPQFPAVQETQPR